MASNDGNHAADEDHQKQTRPWVLIRAPMLPESVEKMKERYNVVCISEGDQWKQRAAFIEALVTHRKSTTELLGSLPSLRIICNRCVGLDNVDLESCRMRSIRVTNTPDVVTDDTADIAILLILAVQRRLLTYDRFLRQGLWHHQRPPSSYKVSGSKVGIVGLGRIGREIANRLEGFKCTISYFGRNKKDDVPYVYYSNLIDLARDSDILIISCELTKETTHLINRKVINALGAQGTLINIARGAIVDEPELIKALQEKRLGAAGLDVFENEPDVPTELFNMDNVVLTPHIGVFTWETKGAMDKLVQDNLDAFFLRTRIDNSSDLNFCGQYSWAGMLQPASLYLEKSPV